MAVVCRTSHGTAAPHHTLFVTGEVHDSFKNVWPIILGFVLLCWFLCTSSDIRGAERWLLLFFVVVVE